MLDLIILVGDEVLISSGHVHVSRSLQNRETVFIVTLILGQ